MTTQAEVLAVLNDHPDWNSVEIGAHLECSPNFVRYTFHKHGIRRKRIPRVWTPELTEQLRNLYLAGRPVVEIAAKLDMRCSAINSQVDRMGLPHRQNRNRITRPQLFETFKTKALDALTLDQQRQRLDAPHRNLAGRFFGDPPVGFSALDKRA